MKTIYYCDFDGTIALADVGDEVNYRFGGPETKNLGQSYVRGEIDSVECLTKQYALFEGSENEYQSFIQSLEIDPWFGSFLEALKERGDELIVLSDGMINYIKILFEKYSIEGVKIYSNSMVFKGNKVEVSFPYHNPECDVRMANCKCSHMDHLEEIRSVYIGDGVSDACGARKTDLTYAKVGRNLYEIMEKENLPFQPFKSFRDIMEGEGLPVGKELVKP